MATSNLTPYTPIPNGSEATPGLWDTRFDQLQKNIVSVNTIQDSGIFPSGVSGPISDYGGQVYNVKAYGAVGDGVADDTSAFSLLIAGLPSNDTSWADQDTRTAGLVSVYLGSGVYQISSELNLPGDKSIKFAGAGPRSTRILYTGSGGYAFKAQAGERALEFDGVTLDGGGVEFEAQTKTSNIFRHCHFQETDDYAIKVLGQSVFDMEINRCLFASCNGGISVDQANCDLWVVKHSQFWRSTGTDITIGSTGVTVHDCDFELRASHTTNASKPFIHVKSQGDVKLYRNRFGNEEDVATDSYPPAQAIVIGDGDDTSIVNVSIVDNSFFGGSAPSNTKADTVVKINAPVIGLNFTGNNVRLYNSFIVDDSVALTVASRGDKFYQNRYAANKVVETFSGNIFAQGGVGFSSDLDGTSSGEGQNLLRQTDALASSALWIKSNLSISKDAAGPDGTADEAFTIEAVADGSSHIRTQAVGTIEEEMSFGVWARKGTTNVIRLALLDSTDNKYPVSKINPIYLTDELRRYRVYGSSLSTGHAHFGQVFIGSSSGASAGDTVVIYGPQLQAGNSLGPYLPNIHTGGTNHAARQFQGLMLGSKYIGYGSGQPSSGRYEQGDIIFNTAASAASHIGWVCTAAGSPGSWNTWGGIT